MSEYIATPRATTAPFEPIPVALVAATTKTVLQVATPSTIDIRLLAWGVSFDGVSGTAVPAVCSLTETTETTPATVTALTPDKWGNEQAAASLCVGGAALTGYNASAEGTIASVIALLDSQHVHPQSGYAVWFPQGQHQPRVSPSRFVRLRCKAPAGVNVIPWVIWDEPAM